MNQGRGLYFETDKSSSEKLYELTTRNNSEDLSINCQTKNTSNCINKIDLTNILS